jgi:hypothetical protein
MLSEEAELPPAERPPNQSIVAIAAWLVDENPRKVTGFLCRRPFAALLVACYCIFNERHAVGG